VAALHAQRQRQADAERWRVAGDAQRANADHRERRRVSVSSRVIGWRSLVLGWLSVLANRQAVPAPSIE
jgi:hypothetical protein